MYGFLEHVELAHYADQPYNRFRVADIGTLQPSLLHFGGGLERRGRRVAGTEQRIALLDQVPLICEIKHRKLAYCQSGQTVGKFAVLDFANQGDLVKQGNTLFRPGDPTTTPLQTSAEVQQGRLESSNVGNSESVVRLVSVMRQFDMLQKAVHIGQQMNLKAISDVAKVST